MSHFYLSHAQVIQDPDIAVPDWQLSPAGRARIAALAGSGQVGGYDLIASSTERKARDTSEILAQSLGLPVITRADLGENDRSATGYLHTDAFETAADAFFGQPRESWKGWETAQAAQARIVRSVGAVIAAAPGQKVLFVGHGAVGTLLRCHVSGLGIDRCHDQPGGQGGCWFRFDGIDKTRPTRWQPLEVLIA